jgi:HEAT repeats
MLPCKPIAFSCVALALALFVPTTASSDEVTRQAEDNLRSTVSKSRPTETGTFLDRSELERIQREAAAFTANKGRPTPAQRAWFSKIRKLVLRADSENREGAARALHDLRAVDDPDAIPALMHVLRTSDDQAARLLYVRILGDMPPAAAGPALAEEALFDDSPIVREAAQEISKRQQPEFVRPYYGQALRFPNREVVGRAASVLASVDNRETVPYLIDALYSTYVDVESRPSCCLSRVYYLASPAGTNYHPDHLISRRDHVIPAHEDHMDHVGGKLVVHKSPNPHVKETLEAITNKSFGYDTAAWRRWWRSTQLAANKRTSR